MKSLRMRLMFSSKYFNQLNNYLSQVLVTSYALLVTLFNTQFLSNISFYLYKYCNVPSIYDNNC